MNAKHSSEIAKQFGILALCDVQWVASELGLAAFVRDHVGSALILYGIRSTAHLATRLSPVSA
jgi:hypothetical protein